MSTESKSYEGGCHCKANRYQVVLSPSLESNPGIINCNCSICELNGYLISFTSANEIKWTSGGLENLSSYTFNKKHLTHYFCPTCGTSLCVLGTMGGVTQLGLNVRSVDGIDLEKLTLRKYDGKSI